MEFQAWNLGLFGIFFASLAIMADEMEVILLSVSLRDA